MTATRTGYGSYWRRRPGWAQGTGTSFAALALLLVVFGLAAIFFLDGRGGAPLEARSAGREAGATVSAIADSPDAFFGRRVTVSGVVGERLSRRAFTIGESGIGEEVLVVSAQGSSGAATPLTESAALRVTGTVRRFDLRAIEDEIGADLDGGLFSDWRGSPVIVASAVQPLDRAAARPASTGTAGGDAQVDGTGRNTGIAGAAGATIDRILDDPRAYIGRTVTVRGEVDDLVGPRAFMLEDGDLFFDDELLVVSAGRLPRLVEGEGEVRVTGQVRRFNRAEVEDELGIRLDERPFADYEGRPVIVARSVELVR